MVVMLLLLLLLLLRWWRRRRLPSSPRSRCELPEELHGEGEDDGGVLLGADRVQGLEVAQLETGRKKWYLFGWFSRNWLVKQINFFRSGFLEFDDLPKSFLRVWATRLFRGWTKVFSLQQQQQQQQQQLGVLLDLSPIAAGKKERKFLNWQRKVTSDVC